MGAYTYVSELWRKKQSDVMRFLQRVRCWEYRQLPSIVRVTHPTRPDKARRLGYKAKQGYVVYRVRVRRGGRKRPVPKGIVYGKPTNQGVTQLKFQRSKRSVAEERAGRKLGGLKVLNSYWINEDSTYKYFEVILVDAAHNAIRNDPRINWICNPVHKHTGSFEDSPLLGRNTGDSAERDTCTTRQGHQEGLPGRGTTHSLFVATVDCLDLTFASLLAVKEDCQVLSICNGLDIIDIRGARSVYHHALHMRLYSTTRFGKCHEHAVTRRISLMRAACYRHDVACHMLQTLPHGQQRRCPDYVSITTYGNRATQFLSRGIPFIFNSWIVRHLTEQDYALPRKIYKTASEIPCPHQRATPLFTEVNALPNRSACTFSLRCLAPPTVVAAAKYVTLRAVVPLSLLLLYNSSKSTLSPSSELLYGHPALVAPLLSNQTSARISKHLLALLYHSGSSSDAFLVASVDGNSDWILDSGSATKNLISIGMLDSMGCSIAAKGGILRISKKNKEMLRGKKTRELYRLEGSVQEELLSDIGPVILERRMDKRSNRCTKARKASVGIPGGARGTGTRGDALRYVKKSGQTIVARSGGREAGIHRSSYFGSS
ncbi:ribosomal protein L23/L15e family protein [Actinidia rufa]|uniref:Ribosomal protein L15 n=1 Tax=Actinidia rufa TaxID=165716 RepID=A0A7J0ED07_9ERIC|nr:ribosomal protein L23/L15e family protein [Actinidia rufa]